MGAAAGLTAEVGEDPDGIPPAAPPPGDGGAAAEGGGGEAPGPNGRGDGFTVGAAAVGAGAGGVAPRASLAGGRLISSRIRSTVDGSRLAKGLTLTSSSHF